MATATSFPVEIGLRAIIHDLGVRPADVFRRARLPEDFLSRLPTSLPPDEYFGLWEALGAEVGDEAFPLRIVEAFTAEALSPPLFAALCSPDLVVASQRISQYKRLCAPMRLDVKHSAQGLSVSVKWLHADVVPPPSLNCFELAFLTKVARMATRERIEPVRVTSPRPPSPAAAYTEYFGVAVEEGRATSIRFSRQDAERPFLTANESMWETFEPELRRRLSEIEENATVAERVRAVLLESLPSGQTQMEWIARRLAFSKRTLQRRLREEGTTFASLLSETREDLARHYLARTRFTASEIAFLLGFEEPSSFFRAFHEWTGETPEAMRTRLSPAAS